MTPTKMTPEQERLARLMYPPIHPAVAEAVRRVVWGNQ